MAPFKLKFRMGGSSRSTSQEHDPDPQVNEALLNHHSTAIGASSSTIDSADCTSLGSLGTNERKSLLPHKSNNLRLGYLNQGATQQQNSVAEAAAPPGQQVPQTPPPSYEHVLEENTRLANGFELCPPQRQHSGEESVASSTGNVRNSIHREQSLAEEEDELSPCTDPDCIENIANEQQKASNRYAKKKNSSKKSPNNNEQTEPNHSPDANEAGHLENINDNDNNDDEENEDDSEATRKESIDSTELLISTNMTAPSSQENLLDNCNCNCNAECGHGGRCCDGSSQTGHGHGQEGDFCDPLMNHGECCSNDNHHYSGDSGRCELSQGQAPPEYTDRRSDSDSDDGGWDTTQMSNSYQQQCHQQQQQQQCHQQQQQCHQQQQHHQQQHQQQQQYQHSQQEERSQTPEIISNKSSKEIYKDLAKQWGITCKMSDGCRCMECQSHYFDCEYDDNEHQKTDGGLGAGTPMFISEVMHGTACTIL